MIRYKATINLEDGARRTSETDTITVDRIVTEEQVNEMFVIRGKAKYGDKFESVGLIQVVDDDDDHGNENSAVNV